MSTMRHTAKVALVTGAGAGIGRGTARVLASEGARLIIADINSKLGEETVNLI
jgi:NAD(P)-dependent dehydrogenase (short-subunit alcohol dehydrogenase family)